LNEGLEAGRIFGIISIKNGFVFAILSFSMQITINGSGWFDQKLFFLLIFVNTLNGLRDKSNS
jgi:hypothetical protein